METHHGPDSSKRSDGDAQLRRRTVAVWPPLSGRRRCPHRSSHRRKGPESRRGRRVRALAGFGRVLQIRPSEASRRILRHMPAPRLEGAAVLLVDDLDAACVRFRKRTRIRPPPATRGTRLPHQFTSRYDLARRKLRRVPDHLIEAQAKTPTPPGPCNRYLDWKDMEYTRLGSTGMKVSRLCLGAMTYGSRKWRPW